MLSHQEVVLLGKDEEEVWAYGGSESVGVRFEVSKAHARPSSVSWTVDQDAALNHRSTLCAAVITVMCLFTAVE